MLDEDFMKQALRLACRGMGKTSPNPMVGAVIVKDNRVIGRGYHRRFGGSHAEINAIESSGGDVRGATLYVNLEPCCHYGKTPPCVEAIIKSGISRVVIGTMDPNPLVNGKGIKMLGQKGIETVVGVLEEECRSLNEAYFKYVAAGVPFVTVKFAQTLDGRIAATTGRSRWISSAASRKLAHRLRTSSDAIMVGIGTVLADNPQLTARLVRGRNPARIVLDSALRIPLDSRVLQDQESAPTIIAATPLADGEKAAALRGMGIEVLIIGESRQGEVDLKILLGLLGKRGISSLLVEGGAETITSLLRLKLVDRLVAIISPKIMGKGIEAVGELNIADVDNTLKLSFGRVRRMGEDLVVEARLLDN